MYVCIGMYVLFIPLLMEEIGVVSSVSPGEDGLLRELAFSSHWLVTSAYLSPQQDKVSWAVRPNTFSQLSANI